MAAGFCPTFGTRDAEQKGRLRKLFPDLIDEFGWVGKVLQNLKQRDNVRLPVRRDGVERSTDHPKALLLQQLYRRRANLDASGLKAKLPGPGQKPAWT